MVCLEFFSQPFLRKEFMVINMRILKQITFCIFCMMLAACPAYAFDAQRSDKGRTVTISDSGAAGDKMQISVVGENLNGSITEADINSGTPYVFRTEDYDSSGNIELRMNFDSEFPEQRYTVTVKNSKNSYEFLFVPSEKSYAEEGITALRNGEKTAEEVLIYYCLYLDCDLNEYLSMDSDRQAFVQTYLKNASLSEANFTDVYNEALFMADVNYAADYAALQKIAISYYTETGRTLTDYNNLSDYKKQEVFKAVFKANKDTFDNFDSAFRKAVSDATSTGGNQSGGNAGGSGGSTVGSLKGGVSGVSAAVTYDNQAEQVIFTDIIGHWAKDDIKALYESGIVNGVGDDIFEPERNVSRAEFTKMAVLTAGLETITENSFDDVCIYSWYAPYVGAAEKAGLVNGTDGKFMPQNGITRQEAAVILYRMLNTEGINISGEYEFSDSANIADYAAEAVGAMAANGIITGYENQFYPQQFITRAESAAMINRVRSYERSQR